MAENRKVKQATALDLERYAPALFTSITYKLNQVASNHYLKNFGIGIEAWRCIALIASYDGESYASQICQYTGMDKGPTSRAMKTICDMGLITYRTVSGDSRVRYARLTEKGQEVHDKILQYAFHREEVFLSVLTKKEQEAFINMLQRVRLNLPRVNAMSAEYVEEHWRRPLGG